MPTHKSPPKPIGEALRALREAYGLTAAQLAEATGKTEEVVVSTESGRATNAAAGLLVVDVLGAIPYQPSTAVHYDEVLRSIEAHISASLASSASEPLDVTPALAAATTADIAAELTRRMLLRADVTEARAFAAVPRGRGPRALSRRFARKVEEAIDAFLPFVLRTGVLAAELRHEPRSAWRAAILADELALELVGKFLAPTELDPFLDGFLDYLEVFNGGLGHQPPTSTRSTSDLQEADDHAPRRADDLADGAGAEQGTTADEGADSPWIDDDRLPSVTLERVATFPSWSNSEELYTVYRGVTGSEPTVVADLAGIPEGVLVATFRIGRRHLVSRERDPRGVPVSQLLASYERWPVPPASDVSLHLAGEHQVARVRLVLAKPRAALAPSPPGGDAEWEDA